MALLAPTATLALALVDLLRALPAKGLAASLTLPSLVYVGLTAEATVKLSAAWPMATRVFGLIEAKGPLAAQAGLSAELREGQGSLTIPFRGERRGLIEVEALWLRWRGPLGLVEIRARRPLRLTTAVSQNVHGLHRDTIKFLNRDAALGSRQSPFRGEGTEFECLTEFSFGMDPRTIDWKRSGRHHKLLAREYREERNNLIVFGFDTGRLMLERVGGTTKLDLFVAAALRLGWVSLKHGDLVGGCGYALTFQSFLKPGRGPKFFARLQAFTAALGYQKEETNHALALSELMGRLRRRALIVLFTEFIDDVSAELLLESLALLTKRHAVVFVTMEDPALSRLRAARPKSLTAVASAVLADDFATNREIVLNRVRRLGAHCLDSPAGQLAGRLIDRYLTIKRRGLL